MPRCSKRAWTRCAARSTICTPPPTHRRCTPASSAVTIRRARCSRSRAACPSPTSRRSWSTPRRVCSTRSAIPARSSTARSARPSRRSKTTIQSVEAFVPVASPPLLTPATRGNGVRVTELPATDVAVLDAPRRVRHPPGRVPRARRVGRRGSRSERPARPRVLPRLAVDTSDLDELRTELCWPLHTRKVPSS